MIPQSLEAATALTHAGFAVVPSLPHSKKIRVHDWPEMQLTLDELPQHFNGAEQNISINWKTSGGRCALDLDATEAEELGELLLPRDTPAFGRSGRLRQVIFECPNAVCCKLKHNNEMLVEVLAGGCNSLAPGSTHPDGEPVQWCAGRSRMSTRRRRWRSCGCSASPPSWPVLHCCCGTGATIAGQGVRHDTTLQLAGAMLHAGWKPAAVKRVLHCVFVTAADPELKDRLAAIETTIKRQQAGLPFQGCLNSRGRCRRNSPRRWCNSGSWVPVRCRNSMLPYLARQHLRCRMPVLVK